ncbi:MAG: response regulator [Gemmatimonadaceae bacterium]|nr:response regulator [Chitinophagaceae bacterium]
MSEILFPSISMNDRIQAADWSDTPLGPMSDWPQSLKATIKTMLGSRYPMILLWGEELIQIYNDSYTGLIGDKHPYALGQSIKETLAESWTTIGPMIRQVMKTGVSNWVPAQLLPLNRTGGFNEETYFSLSYSAVENDENVITGMLCVCSEVTQQVLGERRLRMQRDLAAKASEIRSVETVCHDIAATISDYSLDMPFMQLYVKDNVGTLQLKATVGIEPIENTDGPDPWYLNRALAGETVIISGVQHITEIKKGVWQEPVEKAVTLPIPSAQPGNPLGVLVAGVSPNAVFDENYQSFLALVASQISVALRNASAYEEEKKRAEALAELDRAKTAFFSNISHEFRTPLTLMLGPLEDVLANTNSQLADTDKKHITTAYQNSLRLLKLVNSLLDFSRIEANRAEATFTPVSIGSLTSELANSFESAMVRASIDFIVDCPPISEPIFIDQEMWEKIVLNLLSNALKFTFEGEIKVALKEADNQVILTVSDTGVGIPEGELPNIFKRFHRVQNSKSRSHEGTGIGLALTKELVQIHGGTISVESKEGKGSRFTVSIPKGFSHLEKSRVRRAASQKPTGLLSGSFANDVSLWADDLQYAVPPGIVEAPPAAASEITSKHESLILIVDDNLQMLNYIHRTLAPIWKIEMVRDGQQALDFIINRKPDLVLSDVMMPNMNGFELLAKIRQNPAFSDLPVILLSARAGSEATIEGLEKGANDYLIKPFNARELIARVTAQLDIKKTRLDNATLKESERKFRTLAESTPEKVWSCGTDGVLKYWNQNMQAYTGLSDDEHRFWTNFTHADDFDISSAIWKSANRGGSPYELECRFRRHDGEYRWHLTRAVPDKNDEGSILAWIGTCTDIHNQKLFAEELERRVEERTLDLKKINSELEQFAYAASHDLQEPLRKIIIFSDLLGKRLIGQPEDVQKHIEKISIASERMRILISDLLNFSRLSEKQIHFESTDLNSVINTVLADFDLLIQQKEVSIHLDVLPTIEAIPFQMHQLFYNIISNSLKFTSNSRKPVITLKAVRLEHSAIKEFSLLDDSVHYIRIDIADNGIGFGNQYADQIFTLFKRLNNPRAFIGTGIGLALCKKIVLNHHGEIFASAIEDEGATFSLILPERQVSH